METVKIPDALAEEHGDIIFGGTKYAFNATVTEFCVRPGYIEGKIVLHGPFPKEKWADTQYAAWGMGDVRKQLGGIAPKTVTPNELIETLKEGARLKLEKLYVEAVTDMNNVINSLLDLRGKDETTHD